MSLAEKLDDTYAAPSSTVQKMPFWRLSPSPLNPRKHARSTETITQLANSILAHGILQNLVVRPREKEGHYEIAAGEGRWLAVKELLERGAVDEDYELPVAVKALTDDDMIEIGLIENIQRNDLHPLDEAEAYLQLYNSRLQTDGKAAAAECVEYLAAKVNRSKRYIQKRIRLARDLLPAWRQQLSDGKLSVSVANVLATMPEERQLEELDTCKLDDGSIDAEQVENLRPDHLDYQYPEMDWALFDRSLYTGETTDINGVEYATDAQQFDALQKQAADELVKKYRAQARAGDIAFFETTDYYRAWMYEVVMVDGRPDPNGGVVYVKSMAGPDRFHLGLRKTEDTVKAEQKDKREKTERTKRIKEAKQKPEVKPDHRVAQVRDEFRLNPDGLLAVKIFNSIGDESIWWVCDRTGWVPPEARQAVAKFLTDTTGSKLPKGAKLLETLLDLDRYTLLRAWALLTLSTSEQPMIDKPTAAEQLLFAHFGTQAEGELALPAKGKPKPAKNPRTSAKRTASKTKPTTKKGKKK